MSAALGQRRLPNFLHSFVDFAATYSTTPLFSKYAALWMIGTAVTRAVGMKARGNDLHPNFFFQLVGGPGTGKSQAVKATREILLPATKMSLIPASITRAGLEDYMKGNVQTNRKSPDGGIIISNECIGLSEEMQGILPDQDLGHLTLYNILYDLPNLHVAVTRTHGEVRLESPYCSILTGAQPAFLATTMPEQAWGMGFMSRSVMVFDVPRTRTSMFLNIQVDHKLKADLIHDLRMIHNLHGWMTWTKQAVDLYDEWYVKHGGNPIPQAKRLAMGYNARRELHMVKLAMAMSIARGNDLIVQLDDVADAIELLLLTEDRMRMVFTEMSNTGSMVAIEDMLDVVRANTAEGVFTAEAVLIEMAMQRFPSTQVHHVIENLVSSQALKVHTGPGSINARGMRQFLSGNKASPM
jgi:hypothetical protein